MNLTKPVRDPLFSIHTSDDGTVALYLEEQDAIKDVLEDVVGQWDYKLLMELQGCVNQSVKAENYFENLETCRNNFEQGAVKLALMTEDEALNLAQDIIKAIKVSRHMREERREQVLGLRIVK
jgi:hypothetical protein